MSFGKNKVEKDKITQSYVNHVDIKYDLKAFELEDDYSDDFVGDDYRYSQSSQLQSPGRPILSNKEEAAGTRTLLY